LPAKWDTNFDETILYMVDVLTWQAFQAEHGCGPAEYIV